MKIVLTKLNELSFPHRIGEHGLHGVDDVVRTQDTYLQMIIAGNKTTALPCYEPRMYQKRALFSSVSCVILIPHLFFPGACQFLNQAWLSTISIFPRASCSHRLSEHYVGRKIVLTEEA